MPGISLAEIYGISWNLPETLNFLQINANNIFSLPFVFSLIIRSFHVTSFLHLLQFLLVLGFTLFSTNWFSSADLKVSSLAWKAFYNLNKDLQTAIHKHFDIMITENWRWSCCSLVVKFGIQAFSYLYIVLVAS